VIGVNVCAGEIGRKLAGLGKEFEVVREGHVTRFRLRLQ
jgi:hypothetical protein